jgi:hypothetical protein
MKYINVKINNKEYKIEKLALGRYADLLEALDKIPQKISGLDSLAEDKILEVLPKMLGESFDEIVDIVSIGSGISKEELKEQFGLADVAKIVQAIFEVNEFKELGKVLGGLRPKVKAETPIEIGSEK